VADSPDADAIARTEPDVPVQDPIVSRSTSGILLVCTLLMMLSLAWALWDEAYGQRPWRGMQKEFVERYTRYLKTIRKDAKKSEEEVKQSAEYQTLDEEAKAAQAAADPRKQEIDKEIAAVQNQLDAVTEPFQDQRGRITVLSYNVETANGDSQKNKLRKEVEQKKQETIKVKMPAADGSGKTAEKSYTYTALEKEYNDLKDKKSKLLSEKAELLKEPSELAKKRDEYLKNHVTGLTDPAIAGLIKKNESFDYSIAAHQISVPNANIVDRCESCHLGVREPLNIKASDMAPSGPGKQPDELARAFVSHPNKELLQIHNPDRFGCSSCHGGNGRATTTVEKAHGRNPFWLHPMYAKENTQAGCQQCHTNDRVLQGADTLNLGKDMFYQRGCVGCHRYEGFDRDADALTNTRQTISQLEDQIAANDRQSRQDEESSANVPDTDEGTAEGRRLLAHAESLRVTNSQLAARIDQLNLSSRYLLMDQKKVGPNLKDVRLKLRKEWIPVWLENPQAFRPGTKMPTFWRFGDAGTVTAKDADAAEQIKAISAYLWQNGFDGQIPQQQGGNPDHGKELFESRGCMACHSIGEGDERVGGTFAANLQRVGEKASFDYIVRWIYNPRERFAPYCPKEKRDLTREDYEKHNQPFVFDKDHSTCPNDGAELQVQNMTVMPNFRLQISDARDIASYLFKLAGQPSYPEASFMDQSDYAEKGKTLIKQYGCAGCHEIKGFEEEQRIGKELTAEGATPIERLDFALLTKDAEEGRDPLKLHPKKKGAEQAEEWYNHRGFFEHKLADPSIYDKGKEKDPKDRLRMPRPYLTDEWRTALTTFLLGSVGQEGASVPSSLFYSPTDRGRDIQEGWWVVKKYNCMGCHNVQVGQASVLMGLPMYQTADMKDQLPPRLTSEGARVDPDWLLRFLRDPSLSDQKGGPEAGRSDKTVGQPATASNQSPYAGENGQQQNANGNNTGNQNAGNQNGPGKNGGGGNNQAAANLKPQPGLDRNGVRPYLKVRMPTFNFSPNELRTLVRFFMAVSAQQEPYIKENLEPLTDQERLVARTIFTSGTPCLKCHITGEAAHDKTAIAPNFLLAGERLKPDWTFRWLLDPSQISPGTAMPTGLFKKAGEIWVVNQAQVPQSVSDYHKDHVNLLVRYMFLMTPDEQRKLMATSPTATAGQPPAPKENGPNATGAANQKISRNAQRQGKGRAKTLAELRINGPELRIDGPMARAPDTPLAVVHRTGNYSP
jgi:cytochrome c2